MKTFLALWLIAIPCMAVEVTVVGRGTDPIRSLNDAKIQAVDQVVGTFVVGKTDVNGAQVQRSINQYSGGYIRSYKIISTSRNNGLVETIIVADVDHDKVNTMLFAEQSQISPSMIDQLENAQQSSEKLQTAMSDMVQRPDKFSTKITSIAYDVAGMTTRVFVEYEIVWSPKWYDDMLTLSKTLTVNDDGSPPFNLCYVGDRKWLLKDIDCYKVQYDIGLDLEQNFAVLMQRADDTSINPISIAVNIKPLYYPRTYKSDDGVTMYKNAVVRGSVIFSVQTNVLKQITNVQIVPFRI